MELVHCIYQPTSDLINSFLDKELFSGLNLFLQSSCHTYKGWNKKQIFPQFAVWMQSCGKSKAVYRFWAVEADTQKVK